jgi:hypothetical protein
MGTAEVAILTTGVVGLGAPAISAFFQGKRDKGIAKREQLSKDLDELRRLLDELSEACYRHTTQLVNLEIWMQRSFLSLPNAEHAPEIGSSRRELYTLNARLVIRRGRDDDLVQVLGAYLKLTDDAVDEIGSLWETHGPFDYDDEALRARAHKYWAAYEAFVDAAKAIAGSKLQ